MVQNPYESPESGASARSELAGRPGSTLRTKRLIILSWLALALVALPGVLILVAMQLVEFGNDMSSLSTLKPLLVWAAFFGCGMAGDLAVRAIRQRRSA